MNTSECGVATVLLLSTDANFTATQLIGIADERTKLTVGNSVRNIEHRGNPQPDVVVIDNRSLTDTTRQLRRVRRRWRTAAILIAEVPSEAECQQFIDEGADDACQYGAAILRSRVHAMARRARALNGELRVAYGDLVIDREHRRAWCAARPIGLTPRELDLLLCLFERAPATVGKRQIAEIMWGREGARTINTIEVYVGYLRAKLASSKLVTLVTVRGVGYALICRSTAEVVSEDTP